MFVSLRMKHKDELYRLIRRIYKRLRLPVSQVGYVYFLAVIVFSVGLLIGFWFLAMALVGPREVSLREDELPQDFSHNGDHDEQDIRYRECTHYRALDGICVSAPERTQMPLVAVTIENHFEAWPLAGIEHARVVYEVPVEGNITRFLALFSHDAAVERVGPVRSARPYFVDLLAGYPGAMYMHVGGSPAALEQLRVGDYFSLNEFYRGWYYWRASGRFAPHNVFTSSELWQGAWEQYEGAQEDIVSWRYGAVDPCTDVSTTTDCALTIATEFGSATYNVRWQYNTSTGKYDRYQAGELQQTEDGTQLAADTVVVMRAPARVIDDIGRLNVGIKLSAGRVCPQVCSLYLPGALSHYCIRDWQRHAA